LGLWHDLVALFTAALTFFSRSTGSYGLGIILLTVLIRLIMFPLYRSQLLSMKRMQEIQPELQRLQEKYKNDKQRLAEEQMRVYREKGVNPFLSCLPMLLQLPILYAFYDMLERYHYTIPGLSPSFLWLPSLGQRDPYYVLPFLGGLSTYWQTRISMAMQPGVAQQQLQLMSYIMPLMMFYIFWRLPAGLAVYWFVSNLMTIGQQYLTIGSLGVPAKADPQVSSGARGAGRR
jgi:YidC/Oxa1 family membrane protein insertase